MNKPSAKSGRNQILTEQFFKFGDNMLGLVLYYKEKANLYKVHYTGRPFHLTNVL